MIDEPSRPALRKENECMDLFSSSLEQGPIVVTFVWPAVSFPADAPQTTPNTISIAVSSWDPDTIIDTVRKRGGVWVDGTEAGTRYFLPWPPAGVHVAATPSPSPPIRK